MTDQEQRIQTLNAARAAIDKKRDDEALAILKEFPSGVPESTRAEQLRGLALARKGELEEAQRVLGPLYEAGHRDPNTVQLDSETMGIYARTWMDRYAKSRDPEHLRKSRDLYADAFKRWPGDSYVGLNAAAKSVLLGEMEDAKKYIKDVEVLVAQDYAKKLDDLKKTNRSDAYWLAATRAEIELIKENYADAPSLYSKAVEIVPEHVGSHDSTWLQAQRLMKALRTPESTWKQVAEAFQLGPRLDLTQEVRLAVVMYGGVSLAIYINGVTQELLRLVRATAPVDITETRPDGLSDPIVSGRNALHQKRLESTEPIYRKLGQLLSRGAIANAEPAASDPIRTRFVIDIVSGTSAGGINGIFLAKAMARNQKLDEIKGMWYRDADIEQLINDKAALDGAGPKPSKSLLDSKYLYTKLLVAFQNMEGKPQQAAKVVSVEELDLYVTTTDIRGLTLPLPVENQSVYERRHRNAFHFAHSAANPGRSHFNPEFNPFLAFAARSTSAFPFAFEPMKLADIDQFDTLKPVNERWREFYDDYLELDLAGNVIGDNSFSRRQFGDGGYLDNKPFSHAINAMLRRRADVLPVQRKLIYIEPAPELLKPEPLPELDVNVVENVTAALLSLPRDETIREDLLRVRERNQLIKQVELVTRSVEDDVLRGQLARDPNITFKEGKVWAENDLADMLKSKGVTYGSYHRLKVETLVQELAEIVAGTAGVRENSAEFQAIPYLVRAWVEANYVEFRENGSTMPTQNRLLVEFDLGYRSRRLSFLLAKIDQLACLDESAKEVLKAPEQEWLADKVGEPEFLNALIELKWKLEAIFQKLRRLRAQLRQPPNPSAAASGSISSNPLHGLLGQPKDFHAILGEVLAKKTDLERRQAAKATLAEWPQAFQNFVDKLRNILYDELMPVADQCKNSLDPTRPSPLGSRLTEAVKYCLWPYYEHYEDYDQVTFPILYQTGVGEAAPVVTLRISPRPNAGTLQTKLAGTALANFGGFLERSWRENDLLWGRLDAAEQILTNFLATDHPQRAALLKEAQDTIIAEEVLKAGDARVKDALITALKRADTSKLTPEIVKAFIQRLDRIPSKSVAMEREDLREYMLNTHQVERVLDPQMIVRVLARSTQVVGKILEGLAEGKEVSKSNVAWVTRLGLWFWALVEVAVPGSLPNLFFRHWVSLLYLFEGVMIVGGFLLLNQPVQRFGMMALALTAAVHVAVRILGDYMEGWRRWEARHWRTILYTAIGAVVIWNFVLAGVVVWTLWIGDLRDKLQPRSGFFRIIAMTVLWAGMTSLFAIGAYRAWSLNQLSWNSGKKWTGLLKGIALGALVSLLAIGTIVLTQVLFPGVVTGP